MGSVICALSDLLFLHYLPYVQNSVFGQPGAASGQKTGLETVCRPEPTGMLVIPSKDKQAKATQSLRPCLRKRQR